VITAVDGTPVTSVLGLQGLLSSHTPGETISVHVVHKGGSSKDYDVRLGTQPQETKTAKSGCR
jgi:S1-C subfamily serine protease